MIVTTVANGLISAEAKARLVFLRWRHALPGHRAFSKYAASDPRIDVAKLKKVCGNKFPEDPVEQNRTWYRLYKAVEGNPSVVQVQRDFLLMRDYAALAALFAVVFGAVTFGFRVRKRRHEYALPCRSYSRPLGDSALGPDVGCVQRRNEQC